jgi:hypothetical protein
MIITQEEWRQPGTGAWSGGAEERLWLETKHTHANTHTKSHKQPITRIQKKDFEHVRHPEKLLEYLLRNNNSNIKQSQDQYSFLVHTV